MTATITDYKAEATTFKHGHEYLLADHGSSVRTYGKFPSAFCDVLVHEWWLHGQYECPGPERHSTGQCYKPTWWELFNVFVSQTKRGKGLGSAVVREVFADADEARMPIWLRCKPELVSFYESLGFIDHGPPKPRGELMYGVSRTDHKMLREAQ